MAPGSLARCGAVPTRVRNRVFLAKKGARESLSEPGTTSRDADSLGGTSDTLGTGASRRGGLADVSGAQVGRPEDALRKGDNLTGRRRSAPAG